MAEQPDNLVLEILRAIRAEVGDVKAELKATREEMATKADLNSLRADLNSLRADVASDLLNVGAQIAALRKDTREQIVGVRRAVVEYHSSVVGHGMLISDLDERVRRIEQHLDLPLLGSH